MVIDQPALQLAEPGGDTSLLPGGGERRLVEVAVDAIGSGGSRTYTYAVPDRLADVEPGEAVLVEFGRRQAVGIVLGAAEAQPGVEPKAIGDRIRADGPLLPPLSLALARWIAGHYLAPPALALRAMLPPEMLERLELVAERRPPGDDSATAGRRQPASPIRLTAICWSSSIGAPGRCATWRGRTAGPGSFGGCAGWRRAARCRSTGS